MKSLLFRTGCLLKLFLMICIVGLPHLLKSQNYYHALTGTTASSSLFFQPSTGNIGLGTTSPLSRFQIDHQGYLGMTTASIRHFYIYQNTNYALFQTSDPGTNFINYFKDPVTIGNLTLQKIDNNTSEIHTGANVTHLNFIMNPCDPSCDPVNPLTVYSDGIIVRRNLLTTTFQMSTNPGVGKVLMSDAQGNASWQNPSALANDYWLLEGHNQNIYSNPTFNNVGIGTQYPIDRFQVNDGPYKLSVGSLPNISDLIYGTSYIGFNVARNASSWILSGDSAHNGGGVIFSDLGGNMLFSTIPSITGSQQTVLDPEFIKSVKFSITADGKVGVGTTIPSRSLEICHTDEKGGLVLNQVSDTNTTTEIRFSNRGTEKFAVGYWGNSQNGPAFFVWNHILPGTALFISGRNNRIGINTEWPAAQLDVNGNFKAKAIGVGIDPPSCDSLYKVWIEGGLAAREIKVTNLQFPDFVFESNYPLRSIENLDQFIKQEHHLPEIPSQSEIKKDGGVKVGELQSKLLQKIEEQTLYIISLQKQINELREQININKAGGK